MSLRSRRELLEVVAPRYKQANRKAKQPILDEFVAVTGYHRKYAIGLLNAYRATQAVSSAPERKGRQRLYTAEVQEALIIVWEVANRICSKRLAPFLPEMVGALERHGHLSLPLEVKKRLLGISPATMDRLLAEVRRVARAGNQSRACRSSLLKYQVPIRTFSEWEGAKPGFMEADLVSHCGGDVRGSHMHTLVMTDVVTGWTECMALLFRDQQIVSQAVCQAEQQLPFPLLALDTDNGSEFLNSTLYAYCDSKPIIFTRSRPYRKNDQCYVEQKNGVIVRQFVGYERFEGVEPCRILTELYRYLRLYVNFFQPSLKLISKRREASRVIKTYDRAQTPYQRVLAADSVSVEAKQKLEAQYAQLDPLQLLTEIRAQQDQLWSHAYVSRDSRVQAPILKDPASAIAAGQQQPPEAIIVSISQTDKVASDDQQMAAPSNGKGMVPAIEQSKKQPERRYRRSKQKRRAPQGKRWWRTRKDPFAEVWDEAQQQLEKMPDLSAKELFQILTKQAPGQFSDGQLRTLQRRVRAWRMVYVHRQSEQNEQEKTAVPTV